MKKKVCIVIPCFNESENINLIFNETNKIIKSIKNIDFSYLFVDDSSKDDTWDLIKILAKKNKNVNGHKFLTNHGKEIALYSAIKEIKNVDAIIFMDADLQHPPKVISQFIKEWQSGYLVVCGKRIKDEFSKFRNLGSKLFYYLLNNFGEIKMQSYSTDFRLIDKKVINYLKEFKENISFMRGLIDLLGFETKYIDFKSSNRHYGNSKFSFRYLFSLATSSFINFSLFPLRIVGYIGLLVSTLSLFFLFFYSIFFFIGSYEFDLVIFLFLLSFIFMGLIFSSLGLIALYIGNIHRETLGRPTYLIDKRV